MSWSVSEEFVRFWSERRLATLTTIRQDGSPHVVPVGVTVDFATGLARIICSGTSRKARNVAAHGGGSAKATAARAALCQFEGAVWSTLEGLAVVRRDPVAIADAERRYAVRYRVPRVNPQRVVIEIHIDRRLGLQ